MATLIGPKTVQLDLVTTTFFVRKALDEDRVLLIADLYQNGVHVDPIVINKNNELIEGRHRVEAMRLLNWTECKALVDQSTDRKENILTAIRANVKGPLPPTREDFEHTIQLLLSEGMKTSEIKNLFPLPVPMVTKYIKDIQKQATRKKVGAAIEAIADRGWTIQRAAEHYKIDEAVIREVLSKRKKVKAGVSHIVATMSIRTRSYSQFLSANIKKILREIDDGTMTQGDLRNMLAQAEKSAKYIRRTIDRWKERTAANPNIGDINEEE